MQALLCDILSYSIIYVCSANIVTTESPCKLIVFISSKFRHDGALLYCASISKWRLHNVIYISLYNQVS